MATPNGVKRKRTAPPEVRRQQLIDATIDCISKSGISGTTLTAITKKAGVSLGLANFHFKTKDALIEATLMYLHEEHRDLWKKLYDDAAAGAKEKLTAIIDAQFHPQVCNRRKIAVWFAFWGEAGHRKFFTTKSKSVDTERYDTMAELCREITEEGGYTTVSPTDLVFALEGLFDGMWLNILIYPESFPREDCRQQVYNYLGLAFPKHFEIISEPDRGDFSSLA